MLTGNYGFMNLLCLVLCLPLLDDAVWPGRLRGRFAPYRAPRDRAAAGGNARAWPLAVLVPLAATVALLDFVRVAESFRRPIRWPAPIVSLGNLAGRFLLVNGYGLFSVMTTERLEIVLEGSADGVSWRPYEFRYKPGRLDRPPPIAAPHLPRLDWQMWFAALGPLERSPWFVAFSQGLLEGRRPVLALLRENPFPEGPPRYLRAGLYDYSFTTTEERRDGGGMWRREGRGAYLPVVSLESFRSALR
jgi:hypothetical protein